MTVGIAQFLTMLWCPECKRGESLDVADVELARSDVRAFLQKQWRCVFCKHDYPIAEALIHGLLASTSDLGTSSSDLVLSERISIKVGVETYVELAVKVPHILSVLFGPEGKYVSLGWKQFNENGFCILSSVSQNPHSEESTEYAKLGEEMTICWGAYGRSSATDSPFMPFWQSLLVQAREDLDRGCYHMSIFCSCTSLESFVDEMILDSWAEKGIAEDIVETILQNTSGIRAKERILRKLTGAKFGNGALLKRWEGVNGNRNRIAHGGSSQWTKADACEALNVVAHVIFHLIVEYPGKISLFNGSGWYNES